MIGHVIYAGLGLRMYRLFAALLLVGCSHEPESGLNSPKSPQTVAPVVPVQVSPPTPASQYFETLEAARQADAIVVARLDAVDFSAAEQDKFLTSMRFEVTDVLRGPLKPREIVGVRHVLGQEANGNWRWTADTPFLSPAAESRMKAGEHFLLFTSLPTYQAQARARSGTPVKGNTGVGLGLYRVRGGLIEQTGPYRLPATIDELRVLLKGQ